MKRLVVVLGGLLALPAFAEVAPFYYDGMAEYADTEMIGEDVVAGDEIIAEQSAVSAPVAQPKPIVQTNSRSASRALPTGAISERGSTTRSVASRGSTVARTTAARGTSRAVSARSGAKTTGTVSGRNTVARGATKARAATTTTGTSTTVLKTSGSSLYLPNNTGRVGVRAAGSAVRSPSISVSNTTTTNAETIKEATATMDSMAELTDYCKAQYTACMDNFCNVLDDNQGRCSCSKNLKNYEKTETALKNATEELQEVAQKIQYIGLTSDQVTTLFAQTEAELSMQNNTDNTKLKNDLDRIKNMIVDVRSGTASTIGDSSGITLDFSNLLSFSFDSNGFDLSALFGTSSSNTSSVSNQRGETLYKTAASRCKSAVLTSCMDQGVDAAVITNSYDLEIDKQCIAYERALQESNSQMSATVRNAKTVLQKARLMVAQQKNQYDLRGCIGALDTCMQGDYVCGTDYENCLDPSGKYIVDGEVVAGSMPGMSGGMWGEENNATAATFGLYTAWNSGNRNIWSPSTSSPYTVADYIDGTLNETSAKTLSSKEMSKFLQSKIGYHDNKTGKNYGMCISVLNMCQDYTYDKNGYMPKNTVIANYLERAFRQIKTSQDNVLANYASSCLSNVASCLSQNNYSFNTTSSSALGTYSDMAVRACLPVINTCRSVTLGIGEGAKVDTTDLKDVYIWLDAGLATLYQSNCENSGGSWSGEKCTCSVSGMKADSSNKVCVCEQSGYEYDAETKTCKSTATEEDSSNSGNGSSGSNGSSSNQTTETPTTEAACTEAGGTWANDACTLPTNNGNGETPTTEAACTEAGGTWANDACTLPTNNG